jgi:hypothetical protein
MRTDAEIPLSFPTDDPVRLRESLERMSATLRPYFSALTGKQNTAVVQKRFVNRPLNDTKAAFGEVCRFSLVEGQIIKVSLPPPDPANAGLLIGVRRKTSFGQVFFSSPGCLIGGFTIGRLTSAAGSFTLIEFDGEDYYASPGGIAMGFALGGL